MADAQSLKALLEWYLTAGADEAVGAEAVDRLAVPALAPPPEPAVPEAVMPVAPVARPARPDLALGTDGAVRSAAALAAAAQTVAELKDALAGFDGCALRRTATNLVFTAGNPRARVLFIGEAPGAEEDRQGIPFVGVSGKLLDRMLASIGLDRDGVCISNTVFWRPPGNRSPTTAEVATCAPFVERLIELVNPEILVALGGPAAKALLGQNEAVGRLRGRWFEYTTPRMARPAAATAMFHPAYLLRSPQQKREAWRDLMALALRLTD